MANGEGQEPVASDVEDPEPPSTPIDINIVLRCVLKSDVPRFVKCFEDEEDPFKVEKFSTRDGPILVSVSAYRHYFTVSANTCRYLNTIT